MEAENVAVGGSDDDDDDDCDNDDDNDYIYVWSHEHWGSKSQFKSQTLVSDAGTAMHIQIPLI